MQIKELDGKFSLKNNGQLEIFFLGVGSAFTKIHNQTNFFIVKGDQHILVDFGETGAKALEATTNGGVEVTDVEFILPTHSHPDHANGIGTVE